MEKGFKGLETGGSGARGLKQGSAKNCSEVMVEVVEMERIIRMEMVEVVEVVEMERMEKVSSLSD